MIKAIIVGGTGYTGGELLRILLNHPEVEISAVTTTQESGTPVSEVHRDLYGETDLCLVNDRSEDAYKAFADCDVVFLCLGHGISRQFLNSHEINPAAKIIDLGNDFRLDGHFQPEDETFTCGRDFVYGLCESARDEIAAAKNIANPGCFATAIQLALLPLAAKGLIADEIHVTAITGATGAGKKLSETTHFTNRDNNISIYKNFTHQHLDEIRLNLRKVAGREEEHIVNFVPMRGDFPRGIFASVYTRAAEGMTLDDYRELYREYYGKSPFVFHSDEGVFLKEVVNTNKALVHVELHGSYVHISSVIDNLIKGASGQAVQNMNILFGLPETLGLRLKPSAF